MSTYTYTCTYIATVTIKCHMRHSVTPPASYPNFTLARSYPPAFHVPVERERRGVQGPVHRVALPTGVPTAFHKIVKTRCVQVAGLLGQQGTVVLRNGPCAAHVGTHTGHMEKCPRNKILLFMWSLGHVVEAASISACPSIKNISRLPRRPETHGSQLWLAAPVSFDSISLMCHWTTCMRPQLFAEDSCCRALTSEAGANTRTFQVHGTPP